MATKIVTNYSLASGSSTSSELTDVGDLVVHATVTSSTDNVEVKYVLMANEGDGAYTPIRDENKNEITFTTRGNQNYRISVSGVESEAVKVYFYVVSGATGTLNIESTKTAKNAA